MANYYASSRTNYFRVTDEKEYKNLFQNLIAESGVYDFTKEIDGVVYHAFGAYDAVDYKNGDDDYDFDEFLNSLQKIIAEDDAFIYMESGCEKLRYITGCAIIVTKDKIETVDIRRDALNKAREMLDNKEFNTQLSY